MGEAHVRQKIKEIISNVTNLPVAEIPDGARFREDLDLDSLSLLEIGVDVDYEFRLGLPDEQLQRIAGLDDAVALALQILAARNGQSEVA